MQRSASPPGDPDQKKAFRPTRKSFENSIDNRQTLAYDTFIGSAPNSGDSFSAVKPANTTRGLLGGYSERLMRNGYAVTA